MTSERIYNQELLAVKLVLEEWRHLLKGNKLPFLVWTDHKNLDYINSKGAADLCAAPAEVLFGPLWMMTSGATFKPASPAVSSSPPTKPQGHLFCLCLSLATHGSTIPWTFSLNRPATMETPSYLQSLTDLAKWLTLFPPRSCLRPRRWLSCLSPSVNSPSTKEKVTHMCTYIIFDGLSQNDHNSIFFFFLLSPTWHRQLL